MQFPPISRHLIPPRSKYSPQHPDLKHSIFIWPYLFGPFEAIVRGLTVKGMCFTITENLSVTVSCIAVIKENVKIIVVEILLRYIFSLIHLFCSCVESLLCTCIARVCWMQQRRLPHLNAIKEKHLTTGFPERPK
jgi:hypothetical protein